MTSDNYFQNASFTSLEWSTLFAARNPRNNSTVMLTCALLDPVVLRLRHYFVRVEPVPIAVQGSWTESNWGFNSPKSGNQPTELEIQYIYILYIYNVTNKQTWYDMWVCFKRPQNFALSEWTLSTNHGDCTQFQDEALTPAIHQGFKPTFPCKHHAFPSFVPHRQASTSRPHIHWVQNQHNLWDGRMENVNPGNDRFAMISTRNPGCTLAGCLEVWNWQYRWCQRFQCNDLWNGSEFRSVALICTQKKQQSWVRAKFGSVKLMKQ